MSNFKDTGYFDVGAVDGEDIRIGSKVIGHIANNKVTNAANETIGYVEGNTLYNLRDSVMAYFGDGEIYDNHRHIIGHYEGGNNAGAGGAAYFVLFTSRKNAA